MSCPQKGRLGAEETLIRKNTHTVDDEALTKALFIKIHSAPSLALLALYLEQVYVDSVSSNAGQ